jgi:hypothetical protein
MWRQESNTVLNCLNSQNVSAGFPVYTDDFVYELVYDWVYDLLPKVFYN